MEFLLGFDIGGTKCSISIGTIVQGEMTIIDKLRLETKSPVDEMLESLFLKAEELICLNHLDIKNIQGIGISCGGPLNSQLGTILSPPNLPGWDNIPIVRMMEERFKVGALLMNDANACAIAEGKYGAGKGYSNLIFLTFGTGMGAGLILDGKLYSGTSGFAGEVGRLRLAEMGPVGFGKAGSFEGFCSGGGIAQLAQMKVREKLQVGEKVSFCASLEDLPGLTAKLVAEAAYKGDGLAIEIFKICGFYLGRGLSLLIDIINPEVIVLGSIYGRALDLLEPEMRAVIDQESYSRSNGDCTILPAALGERIGDVAALTLADICGTKKITNHGI
ncbi:MAG: ROK family protein [Sediminicola sp.]|tara:strand:+ start:11754 stop:12749 length:996 start_codon:yes stop_codon:yes gene_type:complete